jgi:hypothetical protein
VVREKLIGPDRPVAIDLQSNFEREVSILEKRLCSNCHLLTLIQGELTVLQKAA